MEKELKFNIGVCISPADLKKEGTFKIEDGNLLIENWHFTPTHQNYPLIFVS